MIDTKARLRELEQLLHHGAKPDFRHWTWDQLMSASAVAFATHHDSTGNVLNTFAAVAIIGDVLDEMRKRPEWAEDAGVLRDGNHWRWFRDTVRAYREWQVRS